jgi:hypothetical protein
MDFFKELGDRGVLDEIVPPEEGTPFMDAESVPRGFSSASVLSTISNFPPQGGSEATKDDQYEIYPEIGAIASHRPVDSFTVRIKGWELPRSVCIDDGLIYFQVSTCYPCSLCDFRVTSLHAAIRANNRAHIENSTAEGEIKLERNASYTVIEGDREAFFAFQYLGSKAPHHIAKYLSRRLELDITVMRGYGKAIQLPIRQKS